MLQKFTKHKGCKVKILLQMRHEKDSLLQILIFHSICFNTNAQIKNMEQIQQMPSVFFFKSLV